ncbi:MAG: hypothetical protein MH472_02225 [Bacteroidia bacterium]|nr:hypothetical protein [Bacteroidia bacterium]
MRIITFRYFSLFFLYLILGQISAQNKNKVEILGAQNFEYLKLGNKNISKLIGNVQLKQQNTLMFCDSSLIFESENVVEAFNNVKINHNDSVTILGDYLYYDGNTKKALIKGNVRMVDKQMELTTDQLDYDLANQFGYYATGGKIVSKENTLTSNIGYYYARKNEFFFKKKVLLTNPDYVMQSDTLLYNTLNKTAYFFGSTQISSDKDKILCENGWYNTQNDQSQFSKNAIIFTDRKMLEADSLYYDKRAKIGKAYRRIHVYDSVQKIHLYGDRGISNGKTKITYVNGNSYALKLMEKMDSLFLFSDTLLVAERTLSQKQLFKAYHQVRIYKSDMQAICDSLVYIQDDSLMQLFKKPIMWNGVNQITADTILFYINNGKLDSFNLLKDALIVSKEKGAHYNQIKGRDMAGAMDSSMLKELKVFGNGQSIFYAKEDSVNYIGVNVVDCSEMNFEFKNGQINKATFISSPDATLHPLDALKPEELRLKGFKWFEHLRPKRF